MRRRGRRASGFYTKHGKIRPITPRVIYHPGIGFKPVPGLVEEIKKEWQENPDRKTASDLEAMCYLQTVSTAGPMSRQGSTFSSIYLPNGQRRRGYPRLFPSSKSIRSYPIMIRVNWSGLKPGFFNNRRKI